MTMENTTNTKQPAIPPSPAPTGSGPKPLMCRLGELYKELKQYERSFDACGNDEASAATYSAAERLREVVAEYVANMRPNARGEQPAPKAKPL